MTHFPSKTAARSLARRCAANTAPAQPAGRPTERVVGTVHSSDQQATRVTVLNALPPDAEASDSLTAMWEVLRGQDSYPCGPLPGKEIDALLSGRIAIVGTDAELAAVVKRLIRTDTMDAVEIAFLPVGESMFARRQVLPRGARAARLALLGEPDPVPVLRDDRGGVLVGVASISVVNGTVYVDENRVLSGEAKALTVQPDPERGLLVNVLFRKFGVLGKRTVTQPGRAVEIGLRRPATVIADGHERATEVDKWTYYTHTSKLRLIRGVVD